MRYCTDAGYHHAHVEDARQRDATPLEPERLDLEEIASPSAPTAARRAMPRRTVPSLAWTSANGHATNAASQGTSPATAPTAADRATAQVEATEPEEAGPPTWWTMTSASSEAW